MSPPSLAHTKSVCKPFDVPIQVSPYPSRPQTRLSLKKNDYSPSQSTAKPSKSFTKPNSISKSNPKHPSKVDEPIVASTKPHTRS